MFAQAEIRLRCTYSLMFTKGPGIQKFTPQLPWAFWGIPGNMGVRISKEVEGKDGPVG